MTHHEAFMRVVSVLKSARIDRGCIVARRYASSADGRTAAGIKQAAAAAA